MSNVYHLCRSEALRETTARSETLREILTTVNTIKLQEVSRIRKIIL